MVVNKRSKFSRARGEWTHGGGAKKKRRGAGNRGGHGMGGTGKRADVKKPSIWKDTKYFGKYGFKYKGVKIKFDCINVGWICENVAELVAKKLATVKGDVYSIELSKLKFNKLLSKGKVNKKLNIVVPYASAKAVEKVVAAGGAVEGIAKKEEKTVKQ